MDDTKQNYATPSAVRSITSYPARRGFKQAVDPALDRVVGVEDAIDIHCHAHEGQQDALGVAAERLTIDRDDDARSIVDQRVAVRVVDHAARRGHLDQGWPAELEWTAG